MMREDAIVGVTSNPTIFQKAISEGKRYDEQLREILEGGEEGPKEIFLRLSSHDIADACDLLRTAWEQTHGVDGYVSWEVDPTLAYDQEGTIADAKLAYQNYRDVFSTPRWQELEAKGATKQRCLWASTSTKNPAYRDVMYVEELIGPETVNTMPEETIRAFQDHGVVDLTLTKDVEAARKLLLDLREAGIDYE